MIFWAAFIVGRFGGTYISRKLKPTALICIYFTGSAVGIRQDGIKSSPNKIVIYSMIIGVDGNTAGSSNDAILYAATVVYGIFVSQVYASSTSLCNSFTNLGLTYVFINNLGSSIGTMIAPTVTGYFLKRTCKHLTREFRKLHRRKSDFICLGLFRHVYWWSFLRSVRPP